MCGIGGIFYTSGHGEVVEGMLAAMAEKMLHRGPDSNGIYLSDDRKLGLAHRRLSIVDLDPSASQPMPNEDRSIWIVFNGEIYNHAGLRRELLSHQHRFRTDHSDTEVLIHGYEEWGIGGLLERVAGDFAFAIYDRRQGALFVARDRIGVKPVYFTEQANRFVFASEIKALLECGGVKRDIDPIAMSHYLSFLVTPAPLTMFKGIYKLPPGSWLKVSADGRLSFERYYTAGPGKGINASDTKGLSDRALEDFYLRGIRERLEKSVEKRMMADVPVGVFLSGGVDSSTNVALMSRHTELPVNTFTVGFRDHPGDNEFEYARQIAKSFKTNHQEVQIDERDMMESADTIFYHQDEPLADYVCIPLYFVSKLAHDSGVKVVQVGEGADEQFSGYSGYLRYLRLYRQFWHPFRSYIPASAQKALAGIAKSVSSLNPRMALAADTIDRAARNREHFWILSMSFWNARKDALVRYGALGGIDHHQRMVEAGVIDGAILVPDSFSVIHNFADAFQREHATSDILNRMIYNEFRLRLPELLLMRVDKMSMAHSVESRVPFLDHELVDFSFDIPEHWKVKNGTPKYLLKKAVEGIISHEIIYRRKMGFAAPMASWMRSSFGEVAMKRIRSSRLIQRGYLEIAAIEEMMAQHRRKRADFSLQLWTLFNLVAWFDRWIED